MLSSSPQHRDRRLVALKSRAGSSFAGRRFSSGTLVGGVPSGNGALAHLSATARLAFGSAGRAASEVGVRNPPVRSRSDRAHEASGLVTADQVDIVRMVRPKKRDGNGRPCRQAARSGGPLS